MNALDYILDGLEAALELERELGVRTVEIDREVLKNGEADSRPLQNKEVITPLRSGKDSASPFPVTHQSGENAASPVATPRAIEQSGNRTVLDLVFLHDRPLAPAGVEMMAKILNALGKPDAPIVITPPVPPARITVVLGGLALKRYFPGLKGEPGQWRKTPEGRDVLITYSPAYILRFGTVTPAVEKIKRDMWTSLKAVRQRLVPSA